MKVTGGFLAFPRLLLAGQPTARDIGILILGTISSIAAGVPFPLIGILFGQLLDDFNEATCAVSESVSAAPVQGSINDKILVIVYLAIAQFILIYTHLLCWSLHGAHLAQRLREQYLASLLRQEPSFFDTLPTGEVASRLDGDVQTIRSGTSEKVGICISSLSFFVTAYIVAFIKDRILAGILVSLVPAYFIMSFVGSHYIEKYAGLMSDHAATAASIASEALSNVTVVQAFGANARLEKLFTKALVLSEREGIKKATAIGIQSGVLYFVAYAANGLAFWQGSKHVAQAVADRTGGSTVGAVFTVIFILIEATLLLSQVAPFIHMFIAAVTSHNKIKEHSHRHPTIATALRAGESACASPGLDFQIKDVTFVYPSRPEVTVLDQVSLHIPANRHTAIIGLSGSGKSTIAALLARLYDPVDGAVLYGGHDLRDHNVRAIRGNISLVQQDPYLFNRSLLENIAYGLLNSSKEEHKALKSTILNASLASVAERLRTGQDLNTLVPGSVREVQQIIALVQEAAALADAAGFISGLQHGFGTLVGSSGKMLSGGQRQRVALARALVKDPSVLILDEATASLDSLSERRIQAAISKLTGTRTMVTIAHRLSTITAADNIVVMQHGRVVEQGHHDLLMAQDGAYARLVGLQSSSAPPDQQAATPTLIDTQSQPDAEKALTQIKEDTASSDGDHKYSAATAVEESEPPTPKRSVFGLVRGYSPTVRPHLLTIVTALVGSSIVGGAFSGEAVIFGHMVAAMSPCNSPASILTRGSFLGLMFFVLAIIEFFANTASWTGFGWVSEKIVAALRVLSFRALFKQDLEWHQSEGRTPSSLLLYITRDGTALAGLSGSVLGTLFSIAVNLLGAIILTHIIAWRIALVCLALVPLLLGSGLMELRVLGRFEEKHATAYADALEIGVEAVSSIKTVACLSLEDLTMTRYREALKGPRRETFRVSVQASFWQAMMYFLGNLMNAMAYWWGGRQITAGNYTQTQFLIVVFSLLVGALLWSQMFALAPELTNARAAMSRILSLIELGQERIAGHLPLKSTLDDVEADGEAKNAMLVEPRAVAVSFQDVRFSYPSRPDVKVLDGLSLDIKPGQFCALVGPSGAGKSTIISLIERMYTPQSGTVLVDGRPITASSSPSFRDCIALVPQDSVVFDGSVAFNIGLGARPGHEAQLDDIIEACKLANIHETIATLPQGYDTPCGAGGNQFSGGQKQRLAIARALVRKPGLLLLDEPTSALDAESEKLLQEGLERATASGVTVVAIAHRLHTIRKADVIFMIEEGRCVVSGTHEELMRSSEGYRTNMMHQTVGPGNNSEDL